MKDDWHKPRTKGQPLNAREVEMVREGYVRRTPAREIARQLQCATRSIKAHYTKFKRQGVRRHGDPVPAVDRRYRSSFEVSA